MGEMYRHHFNFIFSPVKTTDNFCFLFKLLKQPITASLAIQEACDIYCVVNLLEMPPQSAQTIWKCLNFIKLGPQNQLMADSL